MFRQLCSQHDFISNKNISHVLMDGGVLSVPFDRLNDFYEICIQCIKNGEQIFVVEQKTETYNFFLDIDYKDEYDLDVDEIVNICQTIFSKVKKFCNQEQAVIISVALPKPKDGKIKTGIHLNFPGIVVNQHGAVQLMYHIIHTLNNVYPSTDWNQFIDPSVYGDLNKQTKGSGFRMLWSHKMSKHSECKGAGCSKCKSGKIIEGEYLPIYVLKHNDIIPVKQVPSLDMFWLTTLRVENNDVLEIPDAIHIEKKVYKKEGSFTKSQTKNEIKDSELCAYLETFVRKYLIGQNNARITKIFKNNQKFYIQTTSKYCENLARHHSSNHIWFLIDGKDKTICQKCFCRCETTEGRKYGFCKDFSGRKHFLTSKICEILFPLNNKKT